MASSANISRREALKRTALLVGGLVSAPVWSSALTGCAPTSDGPLVLLSEAQFELVAPMTDIIIPPTDTPGARAAGVPRFIDRMVGDSFLAKDRKRFMDGLQAFGAQVRAAHQRPFAELSRALQTAAVATLDDDTFGPDAPPPDPEAPSFFRMFKELTLVGYYTSEVGATQELRLNIVPGYYDGNVPFADIGRAWSQD
ncbi:gluconate 2-dehydrogenase subunit 3 family protein [Salisaeta longa]|uniref:gluconate 2-dehydrogenase subunit 3 family protein n=1 Tax=Salisaeta longa TaxID=503170 RepID=UPI0003B366E1|nr:gluconate 2-dehydrogenase subunit 3 family protein [Salisaeta longa]